MDEQFTCLRCVDSKLTPLESPDGITFFECPNCGSHYARGHGRTLTDRWLSPISLPLYCTIFSQDPPDDAPRIADVFIQQKTPEVLEEIVSDIYDELANPRQRIQHIHNQPQSEESLRMFLERFANIVAEQLGLPRRPT